MLILYHKLVLQEIAADKCGIGAKSLSRLENAYESAELGKTLQILHKIGLVGFMSHIDFFTKCKRVGRSSWISPLWSMKLPNCNF